MELDRAWSLRIHRLSYYANSMQAFNKVSETVPDRLHATRVMREFGQLGFEMTSAKLRHASVIRHDSRVRFIRRFLPDGGPPS